ncbi:MAG: prepilin-type N-terminal cleavage/methylation domain-containing protein [Patescibacteria group bacterium]|nr:prepilin-type N-terminal cleavage/methylation domain-containing protein [Patescibacteria group bacterium]MDE2227014.1 prepilin-type N-terminal cleavage/methylation domain-containing protein [Patescibacteria group bacterium]
MFLSHRGKGQSLVEILIAVSIGALMIIAAAGVIAPALRINTQTIHAQTGTAFAKELMENVRVWSEGDWHRIASLATSSVNHYYLVTTGSPFASSTGDQTVIVSTTTYTRYFYVDDVYRDSGDNIATNGTLYYDPSTKKITVAYSWPQSATNTMYQYITRYRNNVFVQTDWSGGSGQSGPVTSTNNMFSTSTNIDNTTSSGAIYINLH